MPVVLPRLRSARHKAILLARLGLGILILLSIAYEPQFVGSAAPNLSVAPITWNVVGLDSNNPTVGPDKFPVGARVCNTGDAASNLTAAFVFDDGEDLYTGHDDINLRDGSLSEITLSSLGAGTPADPTCTDFYFEAEVTRDSNAYNTTRRYHIDVTADGGIALSTPRPRELFVEHLISQNRNSTLSFELDGVPIPSGGTMSLTVGSTYEIKLYASTATNGYEQIESFIHFPNTIFQILSVNTSYTADSSPYVDNPSDKLYGDSCLWENDPNSPLYRSCLDVGKSGGNIVVTYQVKIIGGAGTSESLNSLIYDFSGSSYHYNSDYSSSARIFEIIGPSSIAIQKQFVPDRISPGGTSTLTITITNPTSSTIAGVRFDDTFPLLPAPMVVTATPAASTSGCGTPNFSPSGGAGSISFSNGTLAPNSSCIVKVNVTVPSAGTYDNTTGLLYINTDVSTGNTASDSLTASEPALCTPNTILARWGILTGTTQNPPDLAGGLPGTQSPRVSTAAASVRFPAHSSITTAVGGAYPPGDTTAWSSYGYEDEGQYYQFVVDTRNFSNVVMTFYERVDSNGPTSLPITYDAGAGFQPKVTISNPTVGSFTLRTIDFSGQTSGSGNTTFRIGGTGAKNDQSGANFHIDYVTFTGCAEMDAPPSLSKSFSPATIPQNTVSTLTFTLSNTSPSAVNLTGVKFADTLPPGVRVAPTPNASTTCSGSPTWSPPAAATTLSFGNPTGASMITGSSCTARVDIIAANAGRFDNVSGYIFSNESGENTGPGGYATATLTAIAPPILGKVFLTSPILTDDLSTLRFTITNPNQSAALNGIGFTDDLPAGVTVVNASSGECGGTLITTSPSTISFAGGTVAAASSCTFSLSVTGRSNGTWVNSTSNVTSTEGGNGNSATDTLVVRDPAPSISLIKQVSTGQLGPWKSFLAVTAGTNVYHRFVVENTGDVDLSPISITDDTLDVSDCNEGWAATTLPAPVPANDNHIVYCTVGPLAASEGSHTNTATASGTYNESPCVSSEAEATYATTGLTVVKSVLESHYSEVDDVLNYRYLVTNSGYAPLAGPVAIADDRASDESCPDVSTVGDFDAYFDPGEQITCSASYTIVLDDLTAGSVTNVASATVDDVTSPIDDANVPYKPLVDLVVSKTDGVSQYTPGGPLTYTIVVSNIGANPATDASFSDPRPTGISSWSWSCVAAGTASCGATVSGSGDITVNDIDLPTDGISNYLTYTINATVDSSWNANLTNTASVDAPAANVDSNPNNNSSSDTDTLNPPVDLVVTKTDGVTEYVAGGSLTYTVVVSNSGTNAAMDATFVDDRPAGISSWNWSCAATGTASCGGITSGSGSISVNDIDLPTDGASNFLTYTINAAVDAGWSTELTNVASVTAPAGTSELNPDDNTASDTDTLLPEPSLALTKTGTLDNTVLAPSDQSNPGDRITYSFSVENTGNVALNNIVVTDPLLPSLGCSITLLNVGATSACTATNNVYTLTQADIDAGLVDNTAAADSDETEPATDDESVSLTQAPALSIEKSISEDDVNWVDQVWVDVGDTVYFRIRVTNGGNVILTGLAVDDGMADCLLARETDASGDGDDEFEAGEVWQFACSLSASAGTQINTATATSNETGEASDDATYVGGSIFDPPSGIKTVNEVSQQVLQWTVIWINNTNIAALGVEVSDPIPTGSAYDPTGPSSGYPVPGGAPAGSTNTGVACTDTSPITTSTLCYFEAPTIPYPRGRIIWAGTLGPDFGAANAAEADHEIVITFKMVAAEGVLSVENVATLNADLNGDGDFSDQGETPSASAQAIWQRGAPPLPATGFEPGRVTSLANRWQQSSAAASQLELEIPDLGIRIPILWLPASGSSWDISWLWNQAGLLDGTAYPGWRGNSVLVGHAYLASGRPGPFVDLADLYWGDEIIVHAHGLRHIYHVRERAYVLADDTSVLRHEDDAWLTLITCHDFNATIGAYNYRLVVRAVKVRVEPE